MPPYEITVDTIRHALRAVSRGFWDTATARAYLLELGAAAKRVAPDGVRSWWLIDLSDGTLQSREITELLQTSLPGLHPPGAIVAVVTPGALHAMQAKRVVADDTHQYFTAIDAAEAWLDAQGRPGQHPT